MYKTPSSDLQEVKKPAVENAKKISTGSFPPPNHWQDAKKHILNNNFELFVKSYQAWKMSVSEEWGAPSSFFKSQKLGIGKNDLLHWAYNNKKVTWHLIDDGANPQIALNSASNTDDIEHAKALLARGADAAIALDFLVDRRKVFLYEDKGQNEVYLKSVVDEKLNKLVGNFFSN